MLVHPGLKTLVQPSHVEDFGLFAKIVDHLRQQAGSRKTRNDLVKSIINGHMLFRRRLVAIAKFGDASGDRTEFRRSARFGGSSGSLDFE